MKEKHQVSNEEGEGYFQIIFKMKDQESQHVQYSASVTIEGAKYGDDKPPLS